MTDENTPSAEAETQPPAATPVDSQPSAAPTPEVSVEPLAPAATKTIGFSEKIALIKKKAEYVNGKNMDPVAAEEQARKDLNLPPLTEAEKVQPASKNIFEKVLDFFGLNKKLTAKSADSASAEPVEAPVLSNEPTEVPADPTPIEPVAPVQNSAPSEAAASTEEAQTPPQQPQAAAPVEGEAEKPQA